ncbi:hypothetical protein [Escherichia coli]|uniref:hypothetical protein n=3 Tax=Escherichia coli TaxID=562 RepID=UPI0013026168|nr:hypothetical protein [Escherichia coli]KAE9788187.1 hypothetical protein GP652_20860 [Escherichia coli]MWN30208.1 hypothetical protein [Escherichia coli]MWN46187.1 hypothetical protein [Escherichia coli]MWN50800.1 hypothetical protein [Escherichia coli]MWN64883.1 hypothetical protein [Escherichia coli]
MNNEQQLREICQFINRERVLTLSVAAEGMVWSASCFYQFQEEQMVLYLMSDINSRHSQLMLKAPIVSGTIISSVKSMMSMKGMQYLAHITPLCAEEEQQARNFYCKRYPISRVMDLKIWQLQLMEIKFTQRFMGMKRCLHWLRTPKLETYTQ